MRNGFGKTEAYGEMKQGGGMASAKLWLTENEG